MGFRTEIKFRLSATELSIIKARLLSAGMVPLFAGREIKSVYFDTRDFSFFHASEEGTLPRRKVRVRWYPDPKANYTLEEKISSIEGRFKTATPIKRLYRQNVIPREIFQLESEIITPKCLISYQREYFSYSDVRITFDYKIRYSAVESSRCWNELESVIEIKAPLGWNPGLAHFIPLQPSRFSKYCRAIKALYGSHPTTGAGL